MLSISDLTYRVGGRTLLEKASLSIGAGQRVGLVGPNGVGKSTLFKLIAGREQPDAGEVIIGSTVKMAYVDQSRDSLSDDKTVWEDISGGLDIINIGKFQMASRAYAGRFNFNGGDQQKKVGMLSGGERGRLHLAKTLIQGGNVPAALAQIKVAPTVKDLQQLRALLTTSGLMAKHKMVDQVTAEQLALLSAPRLHRSP